MRVKEHQKQTAFLRQCLVHHDTPASRKLAESMSHIEHCERTLRRAAWVVVQLAGLAVVGIAYSVLLMDNYPDGKSGSVAHFVVKGCFGLGLGSLICLASLLGLGAVYRKNLDRRRAEGRLLVAKLLESHLAPWANPARRDRQAGSENGGTGQMAAGVNGPAGLPDLNAPG
jgi:hypothetical protein